MKTIVLLLAIVLLATYAEAKDFPLDISTTLNVMYDRGSWETGGSPNVTGRLHESIVAFNPTVQVKYNKWFLQPTIEFNFAHKNFNYSNWEQPYAHSITDNYMLLGGLTYPIKNFASFYLLAGMTHVRLKGVLAEIYPNPMLWHGKFQENYNAMAIKFGMHKTWNIGVFKVGPEIAVTYYPAKIGIEKCREINQNRWNPSMGLRMEW